MTMLEKLGFDVADYWRERRVHVCGHFNWRHHAGITIEVWLCKCFLFFLVYIIHTYSSFPVEKNSDTKKFVSYMLKKSWRRSRIWSDDELLRYKSRVFCSIGSHHHHHHTARFYLLGTLELALLQRVMMARLCSHSFWGAPMIILIVQTNMVDVAGEYWTNVVPGRGAQVSYKWGLLMCGVYTIQGSLGWRRRWNSESSQIRHTETNQKRDANRGSKLIGHCWKGCKWLLRLLCWHFIRQHVLCQVNAWWHWSPLHSRVCVS